MSDENNDDAIRPLLPLAYRPGEFDDWGSVLAKDGRPFVESFPLDVEARRRGIQEGIDPSREIGEFVVKACNSYHALLAACERFVEYKDAREQLEHLPGGTNEDDRLGKVCREIESQVAEAIALATTPPHPVEAKGADA